MGVMKKIIFYIFVLLFCSLSRAQDNKNLYLEDFLKGRREYEIYNCPSSQLLECNAALGYAYFKGFNTGEWEVKQDVKKSEYFLSMSLAHPYSRYLQGRILLSKILNGEENKEKIKTGEALISSACYEQVVNACLTMSSIYADKYKNISIDMPLNKKMEKSIRYIKKAISASDKYQHFLHAKNYKIEENIEKQYALAYQKQLALLLIKSGSREGVDILESISINDVDFDGTTLAKVYEEGEIVPQDLIKAYMYYDLSGGDEEEKARLDKKMTSDQIKEALERSWNWQEQHHSYRPGYRSPWDYNF